MRSRVRGVAAFLVVASAPIGMPFILEDRVMLGAYAVFAIGALLWGGLGLRNWLSQRNAP
ncbi:MAG TPA: hypothetical protein VHP33_17100 [Polyangiaceae bacterium]|nr:hypothetical protein [Polyangiaceae bacterium]